MSSHPFVNVTSSFATISAGTAIAAYSFLRFDAVTTLTEETVNPRKTMPRAIMIVALIGGGIFVAVSYVTQLVHPGGVFEDSASAASSIALQIGGQLFGAVFLAGLVVAQFASSLAAQASASRLMYAMGRDSVMPKAVFGRLSEKFHTPVVNLVITGIIGLIAIFLDVATCGRWKSRWRRWSRCGSRSRCSGKEGCGTNCWPSKPQGIRRLPS